MNVQTVTFGEDPDPWRSGSPPFPQHTIKLISLGIGGTQSPGLVIPKLIWLPHLEISVIPQ